MGRKKNDKRKLKNHSSLQVQCLLFIVSCTGQKWMFQQDEAPEDTRQAGSAGVHFSLFSPRSYLLINTHNNCTCRCLSTANAPLLEWNSVCAHCSFMYFSTLHTCRWMRRSLPWKRHWCLCMSCTDNNHKLYSNTNTMWICVTEISSTMYNANTYQQDGSCCFSSFLRYIMSHLLPDNQRLSYSPLRGWKAATWGPACRVCVCVCLDGCFQQRQHNIAAPPTNHLSRPSQYTSAEIIYGIEQRVNLRCCQFIAGFICCRFSLPLLLR